MFSEDPMLWSDEYMWPMWTDYGWPAVPMARHRPAARRQGFYPRVNVFESTEAFLVQVRVPGVLPDEVEAHIDGQVLTVSGSKRRNEMKGEYHCWERAFGKFLRRVHLPLAVKSDKVEATCTNGILSIKLAKAQDAVGQRIVVKAG